MVHKMDKAFERELRKKVKQYLDKGRSGDYGHTLRAVGYGKELLQHEEDEEGIVIPALYLHGIGWGEVNFEDFINTALPSQKKCGQCGPPHETWGCPGKAGPRKTGLFCGDDASHRFYHCRS
jgi:hypothetical protein